MTTISQLKSACKHPSNQIYVIFNILPCSKSHMLHSNIPIHTTKATNIIRYYKYSSKQFTHFQWSNLTLSLFTF